MEYLLGFLIATAVGLTGVGAGSITAPMLILFFHLTPAGSVGTALSFAAVIKFAVFPLYLRRKQVNLRILLLLCAGGVPGAFLGVRILSFLNTSEYQKRVLLLIGATILIVSLGNLYRSLRYAETSAQVDRSLWLLPIGMLIGGEVGFSSAGAGALGSLALLNLTNLTVAQVVGTDMVFGLVVSTVGSGLHLFAGNYDKPLLLKMIAGGLVGVWSGAILSSKVPAKPLRLGLSLWLAFLGAQLCWRAAA